MSAKWPHSPRKLCNLEALSLNLSHVIQCVLEIWGGGGLWSHSIDLLFILNVCMFLDGELCDTCRPIFDRTFQCNLIVDVHEFAQNIKHFKPAHVYLDQDVTKSKLRGPYRIEDSSGSSHTTRSTRKIKSSAEYSSGSTRPTTLGNTSAHTDIQSTTMPRTPWKTPAEVFIRDTKIFHQYGLELWFHPTTRKLLLSSPAALGTALETRQRIRSDQWKVDQRPLRPTIYCHTAV